MSLRALHDSRPALHAGPIRLLIVDDSIVARTVIGRMLESHSEFEVSGLAGNAAQALALLDRMRVDIILLDVEMPGTDGLTALPEMLARSHGAHIMIVSSAAGDGGAATVKALTLGASDTLLKPGAGSLGARFADQLVERLLRIGRARNDGQPEPHIAGGGNETVAPRQARVECLAIGASTGGLHALSDFFRALPPAFTAPILITQHLPAVFMSYFAAQLQDIAGRKATTAGDGMKLLPGEMLIAPGDHHMRLMRSREGVRVRLDKTPATSGCLPSVDPMFESLAEVYGAAGLGVVLSGMGRDGLLGARHIVDAGGEVLAQDAATSVVWGMPGVVANAGLAAAVLPPARLARRVASRAGDSAWT